MSSFSVVHDLLSGIENAPSGTAAFYLPGTLTPLVIYGDDQGNATTNPVTLDSTGRATIYLSQLARMIVQTTGAVTVVDTVINAGGDVTVVNTSAAFTGNTQKDINDAALTAFGGQDWRYVPATGAGGMLPKTWMTGVLRNVLAYASTTAPTVNDGVTPADSAIAAAIADVSTSGGGTVYFPPGTYLISSPITLTGKNGVNFVGAGQFSSTIKLNNGTANAFTLTNCSSFRISDLFFSHTATTSGAMIALSACSLVLIADVFSSSTYAFGVDISGATSFTVIERVRVTVTGAGGRAIRYNASTTGNRNNIVDCIFAGSGLVGIELNGTTSDVVIAGNKFSGPFATGVLFNAAYTGTRVTAIGNIGLEDSSSLAFDLSGLATDPVFTQLGNNVGGYTSSFATTTAQTPDRSKGPDIRFRANAGGAGTVTVNAPIPAPTATMRDVYMRITYVNAVGGAVTWTHNAIFVLAGATAIPNTDLHSIVVVWKWDPDTSKWREQSRSDGLT